MAEKRTAVKVYLTSQENDHLTRQAKALDIERGQLIRLRALADPTVARKAPGAQAAHFTLKQYQNAVAAASRAARGSAPRPVLESIAAAVLCSIHEETNPSTL
jgi:hypothetical protein